MFTRIAFAPLAALSIMANAGAADSLGTPLGQSFSGRSSIYGTTTQPPALWYYGPSYSPYYDQPPRGYSGTGYPHEPSYFFDPYYGYDVLGERRIGRYRHWR